MSVPGKYVCEIIKHALSSQSLQHNDAEWISEFWRTIGQILGKSRFFRWSEIVDCDDGVPDPSAVGKYIDDTLDVIYNRIQQFDEMEYLANHPDSAKIQKTLNVVFAILYTSMNDLCICEEYAFMGIRPDDDARFPGLLF
jgi:hypothetical protein